LDAINLLVLSVIISCIFYILYFFIIYFNHFYHTSIFKLAFGVASLWLDLSNFDRLFAGFAILAKIDGDRGKTPAFIRYVKLHLNICRWMGYIGCVPIIDL